MNLFIDTNIYLKFYHFTSDELEELNKLIVLVNQKKINLLIPEQVINEFRRNREVKIADALNKLNQQKLNKTFPVFCKEHSEYKKMTKAIAEYDSCKKQLLEVLKTEIETYSLKADQITSKLFLEAKKIDIQEDLIGKAKLRFDLGNPPGKKKSYGDALNWESLLKNIPEFQDLYFLSDDKDYISELDSRKFNAYLKGEWNEKKRSDIIFYKSISEFFKSNYPDIRLTSEFQKDSLIDSLERSKSSSNARFQLQRLMHISDLNSDQINKIFHIAATNKHIHLIGNEEDINEILYDWFDEYNQILTGYIKDIFTSNFTRNLMSEDDAWLFDFPF